MKAQLLLELRKNRLLFIGLVCLFPATLLLAALGYRLAGETPAAGMDAALVFWSAACLPGMALLFGASGGADFGHSGRRDIEEPLPLSPLRRAAVSLAADTIYIGLLAAMVLAVSFFLSPSVRGFLNTPGLAAAAIQLSVWSAAYVGLLAFFFAFLSGNGVFGALAANLAAGPATAAVFLSRIWISPSSVIELCLPMTAALSLTLAVRWGSRLEKPSVFRWTMVASLLLWGPIVAPVRYWHDHLAIQQELRPIRFSEANEDAPYAHLLPRQADGLLLASTRGDLVWISPSGERTKLLQGAALDLLRPPRPPRLWLRQTAFDQDGGLWAVAMPPEAAQISGRSIHEPPPMELWHGTLESGLRRHAELGASDSVELVHRGPALGLTAWRRDDASLRHFSLLPAPGKPPQWRPARFGSLEDELAKGWVEAGLAAELSEDGRSMTFIEKGGRGRTWKLPAPAAQHWLRGAQPYHELGGKKVFLTAIRTGKDAWALAVCRLDGTVQTMWPGSLRPELATLADGTIWNWSDSRELRVILPDGSFLPALDMRAALEATGIAFRKPEDLPELVHREGRTAWLLARTMPDGALLMPRPGAVLLKIDLGSGKTLALSELPYGAMPSSEGLFLPGRHLYFLTWAGDRKDLGKL